MHFTITMQKRRIILNLENLFLAFSFVSLHEIKEIILLMHRGVICEGQVMQKASGACIAALIHFKHILV